MKKIIILISSVLIFMGCSTNNNGTVTIVPNAPTNLTGSGFSTTQINLSWTDNATNEDGYKIERKTGNGNYTVVGSTGANITTFNDLGLTPYTSFTYRVYAYNSAGNSLQYSNELTLTTSSVPVLTTTAISAITASTATSGGNISNDGGSTITARGVVWSTSTNPTIALSTKTNDGTSSGTFTSNITGLSLNTTYYVRAYATNADGTAYGNEVSFTTLNVDLVTGLVGFWPFNGNANDESGNGNNGTVNGATLSIDRFGFNNSSYSTNSYNQYIKTQRVLQNISNTFTISLWAKPQSTDIIIPEGVTGSEGYAKQSIIHPSHGSNWGDQSLNAGVGINVGTNQIDITEHTHLFISSPLVYTPSSNLTGWHHIVLIYNSHLPTLYVDGILVRTGLISRIQNIRPSSGFDNIYPSSGFGNSFTPNGTPMGQYKGNFDDIRIYNRVLTQSEITYLATH